jgi:MSHA biogenesis protein MshQ
MRIQWPYIYRCMMTVLCLLSSMSHADIICSDSTTSHTVGTLYDAGGSSNYSNNQTCGFLIQPAGAGDITLSFSAFEYEYRYDYLRVYDGTSTSGSLLGSFTGSSVPSDVTATSGAMYVVHDTDYSSTRAGFVATWSTASALSPVAEWHFDESEWTGAANEVLDAVGSLSGIAVNGATTVASGQVCGAAFFDGVDDYVNVAGIHEHLTSTASMSFWVNTTQVGDDTSWQAPGIAGIEEAGGGDDIFWGWLDSSGRIGLTKGNGNKAQSASIHDGSWHHVVLTRDSSSGQLSVYVDGSFITSVTGTIGDVTRSFSGIGRIEDTGGTPEYFSGQLDELLVFDTVISATQVQSIYTHQLAGNSWDGTVRGCDLSPVAEWRFEDESWTGDANEVVDSSGNDYHGQLVSGASLQASNPALSGSTGTCGYGSFSQGMVSVSNLPVSASTDAKTTVSFWMRWDGTNAAMPIGWSHYDLWFYNGSFGFNTWNNDIYGISSSSLSGGWHHITAEFTNGYSPVASNRLWVDGVEQSLSQRIGRPSSSYRSAGSNFRIGGASNSSYYRFYGDLDEVKIFNGSLNQSQVVEVMNQTHPCGSTAVGSFVITHDNRGLYCLDESISVSARDSDGALMTTFSDAITLDTQTGTGSWSLVSGSGSVVDAVSNDGLAVYTFAEGDNGTASFALTYAEGALTINVDAYNDDARDDDTEGDLIFSATGFSVTHTPLSNPPVTPINDPISSPKNSAEAFTLALAAYGVDPNSGQCGIIETYAGNKNITLVTDYSNPTTGTLSASGSGLVTFTAGQAVLATQYNDVGEISITVSDTSASMTGQSNPFVVKPTDFSISVTDNPTTTTSGSGFMAAGEAFTTTVQALNTQGDPTPNYGNEQVPEGVTVSIDSLVFPSGGSLGVLNNASSFTKIADNSFRNTAMSWSEVGSIRLSAAVADANYLGSGDVNSSASETVGRFYPYDFFVSGHSVSNSCSNFTYLSQPELSMIYTIAAITRDGDTVTNYDAGLGYPVGTAEHVVEDNNNGNNLGARASITAAVWSAGEYSVLDSTAMFSRDNSREAPLSDVAFGVRIDDIDDVPMNAANMNASTSDDCELSALCRAVNIGTASFYYGRLTLADAYGPETAELPAQLRTEYWDGTQFLTNVYDSCSAVSRSAISFNSVPILTSGDVLVNLMGGTTTAQFDALTTSDVGFTSGDAGLSFSAPGASIATKSFTVSVDVSALEWLRSDWNQNGDDNDDTALPTATMSFKTYRGHDRVLYWRHNN